MTISYCTKLRSPTQGHLLPGFNLHCETPEGEVSVALFCFNTTSSEMLAVTPTLTLLGPSDREYLRIRCGDILHFNDTPIWPR